MKLPFKVRRLKPRSYRNMLFNMPINASLKPVKTWVVKARIVLKSRINQSSNQNSKASNSSLQGSNVKGNF